MSTSREAYIKGKSAGELGLPYDSLQPVKPLSAFVTGYVDGLRHIR